MGAGCHTNRCDPVGSLGRPLLRVRRAAKTAVATGYVLLALGPHGLLILGVPVLLMGACWVMTDLGL